MIYVTGDTHGEINRIRDIFSKSEISWTQDDYLIICGDFGYIGHESALDELDDLDPKILFIDGNHENYDLLSSYPIEKWNGGKVHRIRKSVIHLMRSQVFCIDNKCIFSMGGGYSVDKHLRQEGISWWSQEMPTKEEYDEAIVNLKRHDNSVDYIITHTAPLESITKLNMGSAEQITAHLKEQPLNTFLDYVRDLIDYKHWYFGHFHRDICIWRHQTALYNNVLNLFDG